MSLNQLGESEVHVWLAEPDPITEAPLLSAYRGLLSSDERDKQRRLRLERDRHTCLVTRALVRTSLSRYADVRPEAWIFDHNEHGRPYLAAGQCERDLRFNLSHSRGLVACAVALDRDVGVDVEYIKREGATLEIAERYFSPAELRSLRALPAPARRDRFFQYWTLKESYIKARGRGLALGLARFSLLLEGPSRIGIAFDPCLDDDERSWQFELFRPTPDHTLALAIRRGRRPDLEVKLMRTVPLSDRGR